MPRQSFNTVDVLRLEVEDDPTGLVNLVQNPNGELGGWGWITPVVGSTMSRWDNGFGQFSLQYTAQAGVANFFYTEPLPVTAGHYVSAIGSNVSVGVPTISFGWFRIKFEWLNSAGAVIGSSTQSGYVQTHPSYGPFQAPAGTAYVRLRYDIYSSNAGANPTAGYVMRANKITVAQAATAAELQTVRRNLIPNPSFETNTAGWDFNPAFGIFDIGTSIATTTERAKRGTHSMRVTVPASERGTWCGVVIGGLIPYRSYTLSGWVYVPAGSPDVSPHVLFLAGTDPLTTKDSWQRVSVTFTASGDTAFFGFATEPGPAGAYDVDGVLLEESAVVGSDFDGSTPDAAGWDYAWTGAAHGSISTATLSSLQFIEPVPYLNVLGPTHEIRINRDELDVGLLTATILDATLDPAKSDLLRPGRRVRLMALDPDTDEWSPLFFGKTQNAKVDYDYKTPNKPTQKRARVTLAATDNVAVVAAVPREEGVATIPELPYLLEGAGVPWEVNGSGNQVAAATVVARNANASLLDQVAITRDSKLGFAWVDRRGVVIVRDAATMPAASVATFDESDYTDLAIDYDTERCINTVRVKLLRFNLATGETVEVPYGPYVDSDSVKLWGPRGAEFTVQGIAESEANMEAYANAVLAANATPVVRVNSVTLAVLDADEIAYALRDLYDLVTVSNANAELEQDLRITAIEHTITADGRGGKWFTTYSFGADGGVAPPQPTPPPGLTAGVRDGEWQSYVPVLLNGNAGAGASFSGRYTRIGKTIHFIAQVVMGSTGRTIGPGIGLSLPVPANVVGTGYSVLTVWYTDAGSNTYQATAVYGANLASTYATTTNGAYLSAGPTVPFTWAAGDLINIAGTYEAAA